MVFNNYYINFNSTTWSFVFLFLPPIIFILSLALIFLKKRIVKIFKKYLIILQYVNLLQSFIFSIIIIWMFLDATP